jgi:predicted permease
MAVATLALGIGANAVVFGVVDGVVLRPLPYPESDRLVQVWEGMSSAELDGVRAGARTLEAVGGWFPGIGTNLESDGDPMRLSAVRASPALLPMLGAEPAHGRLLPPESEEAGQDGVVMLAHGLWLDRFGADPEVVGRSLVLDGRSRTVTGVLPEGVELPWGEADVVLPLVLDRANPGTFWGLGGNRVVARLAPGASVADARLELLRISEDLRERNPLWTPIAGYRDASPVVPLREALLGSVRTALLLLLGAVGVVLLVVCANVANLILSRGLARRSEAAVRSALGAGRGRLARDQIVEGLVLAGLGTLAGVAVAALGLEALRPLLPDDLPRRVSVALDGRVVAMTAAVAALIGVVTGAAGALRAASTAPAGALRAGRTGGGRERRRLSRVLVAGQVAAAVVLVVSAGLLARSLGRLASVEPGFRVEGTVLASVDLSPQHYPDGVARVGFFEAVVREAGAVGSTRSVAVAGTVPFGPTREIVATFIDGVTDDPNELPQLDQYRVGPGYFETLGIPLLEGRTFEAADDGTDLVAIVDRSAAEAFWPGESPLGRVIRYPWRGAPAMRIVGVVGPIVAHGLGEAPVASFYVPFAQNPSASAWVVTRAAASPALAVTALADVVSRRDDRVPVSRAAPYTALLGTSLAQERLMAVLLVVFAGCALLLGGVGVYGVAAYSVRQRRRDFGIRMALGAGGAQIRREVLAEVAWLAVPGLLAGMVLASGTTRLLDGLLYAVAPFDPLTWALVPVALGLVVALAVVAPTLRATRVDPATALREE